MIDEQFLAQQGFEKKIQDNDPSWFMWENEYESPNLGTVELFVTQESRILMFKAGIGTMYIHEYSNTKLLKLIKWLQS